MDTRALPFAAEEAATRIAQRLSAADLAPVPSHIAAEGSDARRYWLVQLILEEMGIRCHDTAALQDVKAFLIASPRGAEIVCAQHLPKSERVAAYVRLLARLLLTSDVGAIAAWFEWVDGKGPEFRTADERRTEVLAGAVAHAILAGQLALAPRYAFARQRGQRPTRRRRRLLAGLHWLSLAIYERSPLYQTLRSQEWMLRLIGHVEGFLEQKPIAA